MPPILGAPAIRARKGKGEPLVMVTAYDAPTARAASAAGVDLLLVGDSLGMVVLGQEDTLQVTVDDMVRHTAAVASTNPPQLVVTDMPWGSYHTSPSDAVRNAVRLVRAGAGAVKLEGGTKRLEVMRAIIDAEVPVMGHLGLTPQSLHMMGGFRVQGRDPGAAKLLVEDAIAISDTGCFAMVLEGLPAGLGRAKSPRPCLYRPSASGPGSPVTARSSCSTTSSAWEASTCPVSRGAMPSWRPWPAKPWRSGRGTCGLGGSPPPPRPTNDGTSRRRSHNGHTPMTSWPARWNDRRRQLPWHPHKVPGDRTALLRTARSLG